MKAVGYQHSRPITDEQSLLDIELPRPNPEGRDLLVRVVAVSVNPVDAHALMETGQAKGKIVLAGGSEAAVN